MAVFWRLILAHFIADFTFQTNKVASWKRESRTGMLVHILTHPVVAYAFTWPYLSLTWVDTRWIQLNGWVCVALITLDPEETARWAAAHGVTVPAPADLATHPAVRKLIEGEVAAVNAQPGGL